MPWSLLAPLAPSERQQVLTATRSRRYTKGEVLVHEGDPADTLYLVESGHLAVRVTTPGGDRATLNVLGPGDSFGELSLLRAGRQERRSATVVALSDAQARLLSASAFHDLCSRHGAVTSLLVETMAQRIRELSDRLLEAMYVGLDVRLCRRLLELAEIYDEGTGAPVVPWTQEGLADLVGGTRPSVNQVLQKLAADRILQVGRGRVTVTDLAALHRRAAY